MQQGIRTLRSVRRLVAMAEMQKENKVRMIGGAQAALFHHGRVGGGVIIYEGTCPYK